MSVLMDWVSLVADVLPWFLGGAAFAAFLLSVVRFAFVQRWIERAATSLPTAAAAGALLPGCAITTLPLAAALKERGARVGTLMGFMVMSALLGPTSIVLTLALLGPDWTAARLILPFGAVVLLGLAMNCFAGRSAGKTGRGVPESGSRVRALNAESGQGADAEPGVSGAVEASMDCEDCCASPGESFWAVFLRLNRTLLPLLLLGLLAVAGLRWLIPPEDLGARFLDGSMAYFFAALAGVPLYVCEGGEVPLTLALREFGVGAGPSFTFLQASVGTCIPTIAAAPRIIGAPATAVYVVFWFLFAVAAGWLVAGWL